jgi:hypothetical protein
MRMRRHVTTHENVIRLAKAGQSSPRSGSHLRRFAIWSGMPGPSELGNTTWSGDPRPCSPRYRCPNTQDGGSAVPLAKQECCFVSAPAFRAATSATLLTLQQRRGVRKNASATHLTLNYQTSVCHEVVDFSAKCSSPVRLQAIELQADQYALKRASPTEADGYAASCFARCFTVLASQRLKVLL